MKMLKNTIVYSLAGAIGFVCLARCQIGEVGQGHLEYQEQGIKKPVFPDDHDYPCRYWDNDQNKCDDHGMFGWYLEYKKNCPKDLKQRFKWRQCSLALGINQDCAFYSWYNNGKGLCLPRGTSNYNANCLKRNPYNDPEIREEVDEQVRDHMDRIRQKYEETDWADASIIESFVVHEGDDKFCFEMNKKQCEKYSMFGDYGITRTVCDENDEDDCVSFKTIKPGYTHDCAWYSGDINRCCPRGTPNHQARNHDCGMIKRAGGLNL